MLEKWKFSTECKSVITEDGIELSYCEFGEDNEEIVISGAFYFHTFTPVLEELGKKYHVYGVVMRYGDGDGTILNEDGTIHWAKQWGDDIYKFAKALNIDKFHYVGKCHGTVPGWFMLKNHSDMIESFCSFYLAPHIMEQNTDVWHADMPMNQKIGLMMRDVENGVPKKQKELAALSAGPEGYGSTPPEWKYVIGSELMWGTTEECVDFLKNMDKPLCFMFGTDDVLFNDYYDNNMKVIFTAKRARTVFIQGERHLMEIDCPDRVASEMDFFIQESKKSYVK